MNTALFAAFTLTAAAAAASQAPLQTFDTNETNNTVTGPSRSIKRAMRPADNRGEH